MKTKYYILKKFFYYNNTFHAPKDRAMCDGWDRKLTFNSKKEAEEYLIDLGITDNFKGSTWASDGQYILDHGEYERPEYQIRKVRNT